MMVGVVLVKCFIILYMQKYRKEEHNMVYAIFYCKSCEHYTIVEDGSYDYCTCGSTQILKMDLIYENQIDEKIHELKRTGKEVY